MVCCRELEEILRTKKSVAACRVSQLATLLLSRISDLVTRCGPRARSTFTALLHSLRSCDMTRKLIGTHPYTQINDYRSHHFGHRSAIHRTCTTASMWSCMTTCINQNSYVEGSSIHIPYKPFDDRCQNKPLAFCALAHTHTPSLQFVIFSEPLPHTCDRDNR